MFPIERLSEDKELTEKKKPFDMNFHYIKSSGVPIGGKSIKMISHMWGIIFIHTGCNMFIDISFVPKLHLKSSESGRKSSENRQKRRYVL